MTKNYHMHLNWASACNDTFPCRHTLTIICCIGRMRGLINSLVIEGNCICHFRFLSVFVCVNIKEFEEGMFTLMVKSTVGVF